MQIPPAYSAIKVGGKTAYARARAGETVELEARPITIYDIAVERIESPLLTIHIRCSAGTYIRSIAHDIGIDLGCGGALDSLCRTASGNFRIDEALEWGPILGMSQDGTLEGHLMTPAQAISGTDSVQLDAENLRHVLSGRTIPGSTGMARLGQAYAPDGRFVGILESDIDHCVWKPRKVFPTLV
jgi:tRNA pseudouridine55 synthase